MTISEIAGKKIEFEIVANSIIQGFEKVFNIKIVKGSLTTHEQKCVENLLIKYKEFERRQS